MYDINTIDAYKPKDNEIININDINGSDGYNYSNIIKMIYSNINQLDEKDEPCNNICNNCTSNFKECVFCEGLFILSDFNNHNKICSAARKNIRVKDDHVFCNACKTFIKITNILDHDYKCNINNNINLQIQNEFKVKCNFCNLMFPAILIEAHEKSCSDEKSAEFLIKEEVLCEICNSYIKIVHVSLHSKVCRAMKFKKVEIEKSLIKLNECYPKHWTNSVKSSEVINDNLTIIELDPLSNEYKSISSKVTKYNINFVNYKIMKINRIQNKNLWVKYASEKRKIDNNKQKNTDEKQLFFSKSVMHPNEIPYNGLDISFSSDKNKFGRGLYFTQEFNSNYKCPKNYNYFDDDVDLFHNKHYYQTMSAFYCNVLTGISYSNPVINYYNKRKPHYGKYYEDYSKHFYYKPPIYRGKEPYDSILCLNEHIVFENSKVYPQYEIVYRVTDTNCW